MKRDLFNYKHHQASNYSKSSLIFLLLLRLYVKAVFTGYKRSQRNQREHTSLLKLDGVYNTQDAQWYVSLSSHSGFILFYTFQEAKPRYLVLLQKMWLDNVCIKCSCVFIKIFL